MAHFLRAELLKSEPAVQGLPLGKLSFAKQNLGTSFEV